MKILILLLIVMSLSTPVRAADPFDLVQRQLAQYTVEWAVCYDPHTYEERWRGTSHRTDRVVANGYFCWKTVMIHNHPGGQPGDLSYNDVVAGALAELAQMRAIGTKNGRLHVCTLDNPASLIPRLAEARALTTRLGQFRGMATFLRAIPAYQCWYL